MTGYSTHEPGGSADYVRVVIRRAAAHVGAGWLLALLVGNSISGCRRHLPDTPAPAPVRAPAAHSGAPSPPPAPDPDALPLADELPRERRAIQVVAGQERTVDAEAARARGLTLVDL